MHLSEAVRRIEVFTGEGRRRTWSDAEKAVIVAESFASVDTVCGVARRHGLTPQQLFTWRRLARRGKPEPETRLFVPAVIEPAVAEPASFAQPVPQPQPRRSRRRSAASGIELEIGGVTVRVGSGASPKAIAAVIGALKAGA